ncbi:MAG TPA: glycoside hydrolase family 15 protein [Candidatus Saccharimonadales bacterium]|nr:glycoside hydrolase family 15 protein [Candidatus Saccharimonadales bacterium]
MPKSASLGNGSNLVLFDKRGQVRDFYFPFVGLENHINGHYVHRVGVFVDNVFKWFDDPSWDIVVSSEKDSLATDIKASNRELAVDILFTDVVYNEKNIFVRKIIITNKSDKKRTIKLFFNQEFELYESHEGDTAYYDPHHNVIIHYKGRRVFLINSSYKNQSFDDYSVGLFGVDGKEGTHKDAEDGFLSKNPIEHGLVDSVIAITFAMDPQEKATAYYWIAAAKSIFEVHELNAYVFSKTPEHLVKTTKDFWSAWVNRQNFTYYGLTEEIVTLFKKSLFILRSHVDKNGSILASGDSDMLQHGHDTYSYMWPRDGAYSAMALAKAGDVNVAERFFAFCNEIISNYGYLMHKYRPDKSLGSSWHPWVRDGKPELPIQEDETAIVLYALWQYYEISKDLEFVESVYNSLIIRAAEFMCGYIDNKTGLPKSTYDLWEEKFGMSTYTASSVYGALLATANFARVLGKKEHEKKYTDAAEKIKVAILTYLYDETEGYFIKMISYEKEMMIYDKTLDASSTYGIFKFNVLPITDERIKKSINVIEKRLMCNLPVKGIARYEGDKYFRVSDEFPGNPWFITTLWLVEYYIAVAENENELGIVREWFLWVVKNALPSGVLSEQLHPYTGEQLSAAPLTWSHAEFVNTVILYLQKLEELGICKACYDLHSKFTP